MGLDHAPHTHAGADLLCALAGRVTEKVGEVFKETGAVGKQFTPHGAAGTFPSLPPQLMHCQSGLGALLVPAWVLVHYLGCRPGCPTSLS